MNFSIVIPCFNEEKNILNLFKEIKAALAGLKYEIIIIDDSSTDLSLEILHQARNIIENLVIIKNKINKGQSYCIYEGIKIAKTKTIITIDCDGQNNPKDIPNLLDVYKKNKEVFLVGGIRQKRKDSLTKVISSKFANNFRNFFLQDGCKDTGCSLKVFDRNTFVKFPYFDGIHRFIPALFKGLEKQAIYVNVDHRRRLYGISKYGTIKRALSGIYDIFKVLQIIKKIKNDKLHNKPN